MRLCLPDSPLWRRCLLAFAACALLSCSFLSESFSLGRGRNTLERKEPEASLPDTATKAVPLLEELLASPTGDTFTAAFTIPAQLRAAAKAVSGKGPNDPQTRGVQRELIAAWLDLQHQDAITALRTNPTPTTVAECNRLEEARDMLPMHLPLEHVVGYACRKAPTP